MMTKYKLITHSIAFSAFATTIHAADLPSKTKAQEYVKACTAYGAGYFYIPGSDTCLKISGLVRFDAYVNGIGTFNPLLASGTNRLFNGPGAGAFGFPFRDSDDASYLTRTRLVTDFDTRTQTEYGTLRAYMSWGVNFDSQTGAGAGAGSSLYFARGFIQLAGFTAGYTQSFFNTGTNYMMTTPYAGGSGTWTTLTGYTAEFGNGISATLSLEDAANRTTGVQMTGATATPILNISSSSTGLSYTDYQAGQQAPDIVANLRIDQAWGSAQISGALHQVNASAPAYTGVPVGLSSSDSWGWAVGGFLEFKLPMLAAGDGFMFQAGYAEGAANYLGMSGSTQARATAIGNIDLHQDGGRIFGNGAFYTVADAVAVNPLGDFDLTSGWNVQGQFRHFWTPAVRSAIYAGYLAYDAPENIVAAFDFKMWQVGFNTIWSPVKNINIGAEVLYSKVDGSVPLGNYTAIGSTGNAIQTVAGGSTDLWSGGMRVQRNF